MSSKFWKSEFKRQEILTSIVRDKLKVSNTNLSKAKAELENRPTIESTTYLLEIERDKSTYLRGEFVAAKETIKEQNSKLTKLHKYIRDINSL